MFKYQKNILLSLCLLFAAASPLMADAPVATLPDNSGRDKVVTIMGDQETGVGAYNKANIHAVEAMNLDSDLDMGEIAKSFDCKTVMGQAYLRETLKQPLLPQDRDLALAKRQKIIKALVENPALKKEVDQLLTELQQHEQAVITLLSDTFRNERSPEIAHIDSIKKKDPIAHTLAKFAATNGVAKTAVTLYAAALVGASSSLAGMSSVLAYGSGKDAYTLYKLGMPYGGLAANTAGMAAATAIYGVIGGFGGYALYLDWVNGSMKRERIHSLNKMIEIAQKIENLCNDFSLEPQFTMSDIKDPKTLALVGNIQHPRYQDKDMKLYMNPFVHTFAYQLYEENKYLGPLFACVAEMDAYNAIATKMIEGKGTQNQFCFVSFVDHATPVVKMEGFWNVLVKNAVANDITEDRNIILTGPNAGGKTTAIKSILQNIVLGQCFGVAAAKQCKFTMFDVIHSYLKVSDDLINGHSLYVSELRRAQAIKEKMKSLDPSKKFFFALDELFTGTVAEDGEECAYMFIERISDFKNSQFIYATHFARLKELGNQNVRCTNYKVDAPTRNEQGKFVYPFTMSKGANTVNIGIDLARDANLFA